MYKTLITHKKLPRVQCPRECVKRGKCTYTACKLYTRRVLLYRAGCTKWTIPSHTHTFPRPERKVYPYGSALTAQLAKATCKVRSRCAQSASHRHETASVRASRRPVTNTTGAPHGRAPRHWDVADQTRRRRRPRWCRVAAAASRRWYRGRRRRRRRRRRRCHRCDDGYS